MVLIKQVNHAQAAALGLVGVGRANATARGTNPRFSALLLHRLIKQTVIRQGHMGGGSHLQPASVNAIAGEHRKLTEQHFRINDCP